MAVVVTLALEDGRRVGVGSITGFSAALNIALNTLPGLFLVLPTSNRHQSASFDFYRRFRQYFSISLLSPFGIWGFGIACVW